MIEWRPDPAGSLPGWLATAAAATSDAPMAAVRVPVPRRVVVVAVVSVVLPVAGGGAVTAAVATVASVSNGAVSLLLSLVSWLAAAVEPSTVSQLPPRGAAGGLSPAALTAAAAVVAGGAPGSFPPRLCDFFDNKRWGSNKIFQLKTRHFICAMNLWSIKGYAVRTRENSASS